MKRVLVANIFGIGDVLFTTPLIRNLKENAPDISVDYLSNKRTKEILEDNPDIENVFVYEKDEFVIEWGKSKIGFLKKSLALFHSMKKRGYDTVFDFTLCPEFGFFFTLLGIKKRIGFNYKNRGIFLAMKKNIDGFIDKHVVEYYLDLLSFIGIDSPVRTMSVTVDPLMSDWADEYISKKGFSNGPIAAIIPGGGASWGPNAYRKRWSPDGFSKVADTLYSMGAEVIMLGDKSEIDLLRTIARKMARGPLFIANDFSLKEYAAILSKCHIAICNDGGPLHIATALGLKTVSIFGPVDDMVYGPYPRDKRHKVIRNETIECRPCYNRFKLPPCDYNVACLSEITPEVVAKAALELLSLKG